MTSKGDVIVIWEVEDGYVGGSRPKETRIPREDWDACEGDKEEQQRLIDEWVQDDFEQHVCWSVREVRA